MRTAIRSSNSSCCSSWLRDHGGDLRSLLREFAERKPTAHGDGDGQPDAAVHAGVGGAGRIRWGQAAQRSQGAILRRGWWCPSRRGAGSVTDAVDGSPREASLGPHDSAAWPETTNASRKPSPPSTTSPPHASCSVKSSKSSTEVIKASSGYLTSRAFW